MGVGVLLLRMLVVAAMAASLAAQTPPPFKCTATSMCRGLVEFKSVNATNITSIQSLFQVKNLRTLLGANNLPPSTLPNYTISASQKIVIPFPCFCTNGTGISNHVPVYTVQPGDGLDYIATEVFSRLVSYQHIQAVNGIVDPNKINIGQELWIPLPCSCDLLDGVEVVHYGHIVDSGSSVAQIAQDYNVSETVIMSLNGIANASDLQAGQILDLPLRACSSSVNSTSLDYPLLFKNDTYGYTANNCVKCSCMSANNWILQCGPAGINSSNWTTCPAMQCAAAGAMYLGNTTESGCNMTTCAYAGYSNNTISTTLTLESTCPAAPAPTGNSAPRGLMWNFLFTCINLPLFALLLL